MLGDLASHGVDLARFLLGEIASLAADTAVFVPERARPTGATAGHTRSAGGELGPVENEDYVSCLLRFASGARGVLEACRVSVGEQNNYGFEIHGTKGALSWDFRRMGELSVSRGTSYQDQPVSRLYVGPGHGEYAAFQPGSANSMGYDAPAAGARNSGGCAAAITRRTTGDASGTPTVRAPKRSDAPARGRARRRRPRPRAAGS